MTNSTVVNPQDTISRRGLRPLYNLVDHDEMRKIRKRVQARTNGKVQEGIRYNIRVGARSYEVLINNKLMYGKEV